MGMILWKTLSIISASTEKFELDGGLGGEWTAEVSLSIVFCVVKLEFDSRGNFG
jgi:hypothetical protein